jgi:thiol peroxidase
MHGNPMAIEGNPLCIGDKAPAFTLLDKSLKAKTLDDFADKIKLIVAVPSVDTPVCDLETRKFNDAAASLSKDVVILVVSTDLPFAQKRFCATAGIEQAITLSDHKTANFGKAYGILISDIRLLARSIFVVDKNNIIQYIQLIEEVGDEPNYEEALDAVRKYIGK